MSKEYAAAFGLATTTLLVGAILLSTNVGAESTEQVDLIIPYSCTIGGSGTNSHTASTQGNEYISDIGTTTLSAFCNDPSGFAIYAVGFTDDEVGKTVLTDSSLGSTYDIVSGTATSGNVSNWAMKLAITQDTNDTANNPFTIDNSFNEYHTVPATYTKVAHKDNNTDMTSVTGGVKLTTTYAAFATAVQPAGTYTGQVKYTLVHPATEIPLQPVDCPAGKICYNPNGGNVVGTMAQQSAGNNASVMLYPSNFSRTGYGFAGWSTTYDYSDSTGFYGPSETITTPADTSTNGLSLYAIWIRSAGSIQNWSGCSGLASGAVTALTDQRDGDTYAVAKLADGRCWMIENLRLDNTASGNSTGALAQGYGSSETYGNFSGLAEPEAPWIGDSTTANSLYSIDGSDGTISIGDTSTPSRRMPRYNNQNTASRDTDTTNNQNIYSYGNYYTWAAATASLKPNNTYNQNTVGTSICPSGWHIPTGGAAFESGSTSGVNVTGDVSTYREFYYLSYKIMDEVKTAYEDSPSGEGAHYSNDTVNLAGDTATKAFRKYPNNFLFSGYVYNESISNRSSYGLYWSSTARNTDYGFRLYMRADAVYPSTAGGNKFYGRVIRCLRDY